MGATTRWKDMQAESLDDTLNRMESHIPDDERTNTVYKINFASRKIFPNNNSMELNGEEVRYNIIKYSYDQMTAQDEPSEDRAIRKNGYIIVFEQRGAIYYIVDQNTGAKKLLRKMLSYGGRNEIEAASFEFKEDFFVWLVSRVYNSAGPIENSSGAVEKELQLEEIKGIRGNTEDMQTRVATSGESVMNVISTLSFLLESRRLNQVVLNLKYTDHDNICVKLQRNTVELERPYIGEFLEGPVDEARGKIYLLLYLEILPILEQDYRMNKEEGEWNQEAYIGFLTTIKETVIDKIELKINSLE